MHTNIGLHTAKGKSYLSEKEQLFIASYNRQASAEREPKAQGNKTYIIFIINIRGKLPVIHAMHDFSVWLRTGSNPADVNLF